MRFNTVLFDLDGTLTDPALGITNSVVYALRKDGRPVEEREKYLCFIGPPLHNSFKKYCGATDEEATRLIRYYREYFADKGIFENGVYDGIPELLAELKNRGTRLILATAKPELFMHQIMERFDLAQYFDFMAGCTIDEKRAEKEEVIAYVLETQGITDLSNVAMVGDRENDIRGARLNGITAVGVLFGYGSREELVSAGAELLAETPRQLLEIL